MSGGVTKNGATEDNTSLESGRGFVCKTQITWTFIQRLLARSEHLANPKGDEEQPAPLQQEQAEGTHDLCWLHLSLARLQPSAFIRWVWVTSHRPITLSFLTCFLKTVIACNSHWELQTRDLVSQPCTATRHTSLES